MTTLTVLAVLVATPFLFGVLLAVALAGVLAFRVLCAALKGH